MNFKNRLFPRWWSASLVAIALFSSPWLASSADYEWTFSSGDLGAALGNGSMTYADGAVTAGLTTFGFTDGSTVPHIGGQSAAYMQVPALADVANGYLLTFNDSGPNGGGSYINQYTLILDVLLPGTPNWTPFFNSDPANGNDADFYADPSGFLGIGDLGYSTAPVLAPDTWYRVTFAADLAAGNVSYYVDGQSVHDRTGGSLLDGRFSLYSNTDAGADLLLFNEGDASGQYTHELFVSSVLFTDRALSAQEVMTLGGATAMGVLVPEPHAWALIGLGGVLFGLLRRCRRT